MHLKAESEIHLETYKIHPSKRPRKNDDDRAFALSVTLTLIILISLGLPLAALLPPKYVTKLPINIILPLYILPVTGSWDPLYEAVIRHKDLNFTVIVNPLASEGQNLDGPGTLPYPPSSYIEAIAGLRAHTNVQVVGYTTTSYGTRPNSIVNDEIRTYASWSETPGLALDGIFFDQTPYQSSNETLEAEARNYLRNISLTVKHSQGFREPRLVIHNPGRMPNVNLMTPQVDITIVFEGMYADVPEHEELRKRLSKPGEGLGRRRENYGSLVYGLPESIGKGGLRRLINGLKKDMQYMFVTDLNEGRYEGWGSRWEEFLDLCW